MQENARMKNVSAAARYARALYQLAQQNKGLSAVLAAAAALKDVLADAELATLLAQPLPAGLRGKLAHSLSTSANLPESLANTVGLMARNNRLSLLPAMLEALQTMADAEASITRVRVETVAPLSAAQKDSLTKQVAALVKGGKHIVLEETANPSLKAGVRAFFAGYVWDASLAGSLERLKTRLTQAVSQTNL